jgi:hypothetical protein
LDLFHFEVNGMLNILVDFEIINNRIKIYLTFNVDVGMNTILICWFHSYLLPTFIVLKFFKLFSIRKNSIEAWRLP